ncbi:MAG: hypothetical protein OD918_11845 [Gammaproteobacteria bacterium]
MKKMRENEVKKMFRAKIRKLPPHQRDQSRLMTNVFDLLEFTFAKGKGRRGTDSKTYTGPALEVVSEYCVQAAREFAGLHDAEINNDYLEDDSGKFDRLRLDLNVFLDGKLILMQESRVWIDKPFATLKYQVIEDIVYLQHSRAQIDVDIIFPIVTFCCDITEVTRATREHFFDMVLRKSKLPQKTGYGMNRINMFAISAGSRSDGYFDAGMNKPDIEKYVKMLVTHFAHYTQRNKRNRQ